MNLDLLRTMKMDKEELITILKSILSTNEDRLRNIINEGFDPATASLVMDLHSIIIRQKKIIESYQDEKKDVV